MPMKPHAKVRSISLPADVWQAVGRRVADLAPWVGGTSDYIRRLITVDLASGVLDENGGPSRLPKSELLGVSA